MALTGPSPLSSTPRCGLRIAGFHALRSKYFTSVPKVEISRVFADERHFFQPEIAVTCVTRVASMQMPVGKAPR